MQVGRMLLVRPVLAALAGYQMETGGFGGSGGSSDDFGGSGGSNQAGLSLARDVCTNDIETRGGVVVQIESSREIPGGAEVVLQSRRGPPTINTQTKAIAALLALGIGIAAAKHGNNQRPPVANPEGGEAWQAQIDSAGRSRPWTVQWRWPVRTKPA